MCCKKKDHGRDRAGCLMLPRRSQKIRPSPYEHIKNITPKVISYWDLLVGE